MGRRNLGWIKEHTESKKELSMFPRDSIYSLATIFNLPWEHSSFLERRKYINTNMVNHKRTLVKKYIKEFSSKKYVVFCPCCGRRMHKHGYYERDIILGICVMRIPVRRYYCPNCRRTTSLLPSFAVRYTARSAESIASIVEEKEKGISIQKIANKLCVARTTIKRYLTGWPKCYLLGTLES